MYKIRMKAREIVRLLEADGWRAVRTSGSHHHFRHPTKPGTVTVAMHGSQDIKLGTLKSIERQAQLKLRKD